MNDPATETALRKFLEKLTELVEEGIALIRESRAEARQQQK